MTTSDSRLRSVHQTAYRVLYGDTDSGGVVYYANYLRYFEAGRTELLRHYGTSYRALEDQGFILPVVECKCRYKASAFYDDLLVIETTLVEVKKISCRFDYRILRESDQKLLVKGYTIHAVVNREGRLSRFPDDYLKILNLICDEK
ncbi:MAG: acyl-CoA thioesterase [Proteobacteria bacterium]|nr:acyl-CoA thioesterase [Pseudomonadota bacterium]MBU1715908.1 acyl-CoA thioesterase [Pseudomonadota bacterium]